MPGVEKVGPKTAVKWLTQYGTLDNIVAHAQDIGGVVGENLRKALDWLPKARELITIKCDVALPVHVSTLLPLEPDREQLIALFGRFEFKTWLRELQAAKSAQTSASGADTGRRTQCPRTRPRRHMKPC